MRKLREIMRLKWGLGLTHRQVARSLKMSHSTVMDMVRRAEAAGLSWPLPEDLDDEALEAAVYPLPCQSGVHGKPQPDMEKIHSELHRKGVTMRLLWLEYIRAHPDGYRYSQFCERYRRWARELDVCMRQVYRAGEKMFVDFAGETVPVVDASTGEVSQAQVFVAVLAASNYTYAEATPSQDVGAWVSAHCRAFEFFDGVPEIVVPDNLKSGVARPCRYEPDINPVYQEMASHYGIAVIPARVGKPRDRAKVENAVQVVERWILAPLRGRTFFSIPELNEAIKQNLAVLNDRPFQKMEGSRRSLYDSLDRPALKPLPAQRYEVVDWKTAKVNIDYHVEVDHNYYSVPYRLVQKKVDVRITPSTVEILYKGRRVASHQRRMGKGFWSTIPEHRPASHQAHLEWTPSRIVEWAEKNGPSTGELVRSIIESRTHPEHGYRSCLGVMRLAKRYSPERLEAACKRALLFRAISYQSVKSILKNGLDSMPTELSCAVASHARHANVRGAAYYSNEEELPC